MQPKKGHVECVQKLIAAGADVNAKTNDRKTPLMFASEKGHVICVEILISAGADVNAKAKYGWTSLMYAAEEGHIDCVEKLIGAGADVNAKTEYGVTSLMTAAINGHVECVERLIAAGADVNVKDNNEWTSLMNASWCGYVECVEMLIIEGADVNAKDNDGMTSLLLASKKQHVECIKILEMYSKGTADERLERIKNYRLMKELGPKIESIDINGLELDFDGVKRKLNANEKELITCIISQSITLEPVYIVAPGVTDKQVYDRKNIDAWLKTHKISPTTKQVCIDYILQPVDEVMSIIEKIKNSLLQNRFL